MGPFPDRNLLHASAVLVQQLVPFFPAQSELVHEFFELPLCRKFPYAATLQEEKQTDLPDKF